jgi:hypothetical protein
MNLRVNNIRHAPTPIGRRLHRLQQIAIGAIRSFFHPVSSDCKCNYFPLSLVFQKSYFSRNRLFFHAFSGKQGVFFHIPAIFLPHFTKTHPIFSLTA